MTLTIIQRYNGRSHVLFQPAPPRGGLVGGSTVLTACGRRTDGFIHTGASLRDVSCMNCRSKPLHLYLYQENAPREDH